MPYLEDKEIDIVEFLRLLRERIRREGDYGALIFFECLLEKQLPAELRDRALKGSDGHTVNAGDFDVLYPVAAKILFEAAARNLSEVSPDVYKEASTVSKAFCDELNEVFQCSGEELFDFIPIKSFTEMSVEAGLIEVIKGSDGKEAVSLTEKGKRLARETVQELGWGS